MIEKIWVLIIDRMCFCCLWLHLHIFASLRRVKFICVLVSFVWRLEETVMCSASLNLNGCWCMSDWDMQVTFCKGRCFLGILPPTIMQVENGSPRNLFWYKPMCHFPLQTMILEGRWRHVHDMFFFHCADKDPLAKKRLLVSGGKIPPRTRGTQHKMREQQERIREGWGVKTWCRTCQSDHVFTSVPLHQSGFPRNRYFVPYASWLYMTIRTDIENDCLDSVQCFSSHPTRDFALIDSMPTCSRGGKNTNLFTTEICQLFPESIHIHTVSIGIP